MYGFCKKTNSRNVYKAGNGYFQRSEAFSVPTGKDGKDGLILTLVNI